MVTDMHRTGSIGRLRQLMSRSVLVFLGIVMTIAGLSRPALAETTEVHVIDISGTIDLGIAAFLERQIDQAQSSGATAFIVVMDTPGGRVDAAISMRDALLATDMPTITLVDTTALSAGALIALATDTIYMTPGAVIGAATPINGATGETADAKTISAVRGLFESTAEATGRDATYAAAMVDSDIEIAGIIEQGDLLTLTASSAVESGLAAAEIAGLNDVLNDLGVDADSVDIATPGILETISRFVTSPTVAGLLLLAAIGLLIAEVTTGSGGLFALGGVGLFALFFWGHLLAKLAGWEDAVLLATGIVLIAVEVFVIPGFGIAGIAGTVALVAGMVMSLLGRNLDYAPSGTLRTAVLTVVIALVGAAVAVSLLIKFVFRNSRPQRVDRGIMLRSTVAQGESPTIRPRRWLNFFGGNERLVRSTQSVGDSPEEPPSQRDAPPTE
ncbi:MAG: ATP-dependent Clp protease proteolytic subunit [Ilumatobacteraceae bacterium]|nr:ATP-dependent Clp protease proteolytic subunit [Ilumatobacteraceae bacterium]